jgi:hypothetical protein
MKKLIIAAVILLATTAQSFAGPIITLSIEFGHLDENKVCIERGLCRITVGGSRAITANTNDNTGNLEMNFSKKGTQKGIFETQFINGIFEVPASYELPADVCAKLGIEKFTVKKGKYKVIETKSQYSIVFIK